jgi:hypothetical protein
MVNFTKIFGLAGAALLFAGLANAQPATCTAGTPSTNIIRGEGTTELVAPIAFTCAVPGGGAGTGGTLSLQVFMSPALPITSKVLSSGSGATEAVAVVTGGASVLGTVSGSTLNFSGITTASGNFTITVSNIRVNATSVTVGTGVPPNISATAFVSGSAGTITPVALTYSNIAFVQAGLGTSSLSKSFTTATAGDPTTAAPSTFMFPNGSVATAGANSFVICNPYSAGGAPGDGGVGLGQQKSLAFAVTIKENFASAFKNAAGEASTVAEASGATTNAVLDGTRLAVNFTNVPANVTLYVPVGLIYTTGAQFVPPAAFPQATPAAIQLTASAPGTAFAAVNGVTSGSDKNLGLAAVTLSSGSGSAVFEVIKQDLNNLDVYNIPVYIVTSANSVTGSSTPISVSVNFNPIGSTVIPNFAITSSTTPLTGSTFNLCTTSLLFPFVTNQLGFDTGLAIANTSTDPFGTSGATAQAGTCTLNFYGSGAPSPANVVTASVPSGTVYTQALSGVAAGFQGYLIAQCAFQYAHGFAFITDGVGSSGGLSQGYLAGVIPDVNQVARAANPLSLAGAGTGETLGN